jgi:O-acetyl-ADP-ribose deacetylase (regulator of RNase III)
VIHSVGPVWGTGDEDFKLAAAVSGSLRVADELGVETIAFPAISTGIFGFPKERAAKLILQTIATYFEENASSGIKVIKLVLFDQPTANAFLQA